MQREQSDRGGGGALMKVCSLHRDAQHTQYIKLGATKSLLGATHRSYLQLGRSN